LEDATSESYFCYCSIYLSYRFPALNESHCVNVLSVLRLNGIRHRFVRNSTYYFFFL